MKEWQLYIDDGNKYLKTAVRGAKNRKEVFTPEILYNIVSMSIEKQVMGLLMYHDRLPENHTLTDLMDAISELCPSSESGAGGFPADIRERVVAMDRFQEICCLDFYHREIPSQENITEFIDIGQKVQAFVASRL